MQTIIWLKLPTSIWVTSQSETVFNSTSASSHWLNLSNTSTPSDSSTSELLPTLFADNNPSAAAVFTLRVGLGVYLLCSELILALLALELWLMWKRHWKHEKAPRLDGVRRRLTGTRCSLRGRLSRHSAMRLRWCVRYLSPAVTECNVYSGGEESWRQNRTNLCVHGQSHQTDTDLFIFTLFIVCLIIEQFNTRS